MVLLIKTIIVYVDIKISRASNYVYQILMQSYEGEFLIAAYDFEQIDQNYQTLLEKKKTTYFSKNKVAKLVINHKFHRIKCLT